uniref:Uncharacterized protein n=1 Tax=Rousettus aegyptiacus TaxID=9407 RepID=A0A7J8JFQ6_ROUAE|nr:hypothetical protein HJG63_010121 [Rousettus aegyptiacus]
MKTTEQYRKCSETDPVRSAIAFLRHGAEPHAKSTGGISDVEKLETCAHRRDENPIQQNVAAGGRRSSLEKETRDTTRLKVVTGALCFAHITWCLIHNAGFLKTSPVFKAKISETRQQCKRRRCNVTTKSSFP